jgi:hypothetical protein
VPSADSTISAASSSLPANEQEVAWRLSNDQFVEESQLHALHHMRRRSGVCDSGRLLRLRRAGDRVRLAFRIKVNGQIRDFMLGTDDEAEAGRRIELLRQWLLEDHCSNEEAKARLRALRVGRFVLDPDTEAKLTEGVATCAVSLQRLFDIFAQEMKLSEIAARTVRSCVQWLVADAVAHFQGEPRRESMLERTDRTVTAAIRALPYTVLTQAMLDAAFEISVPSLAVNRARLKYEKRFVHRVQSAKSLLSEVACHHFACRGVPLPEILVKSFRAWDATVKAEVTVEFQDPDAIELVLTRIRSEWAVQGDRNLLNAILLSLEGLFPQEIAAMRWKWLMIDPDRGPAIRVQRAPGFTPGPNRGLALVTPAGFDALNACRQRGHERVLEGSKSEVEHGTFARARFWLGKCGIKCPRKVMDPVRQIFGRLHAGDANMNHCKLSLLMGIWNPDREPAQLMLAPLGPKQRALYHAPFPSPPR